uniref:Uncharacterized protein n=1 Tax=Zea mays TaxID=4577 RepID=A0A804MQV1_MAIZE
MGGVCTAVRIGICYSFITCIQAYTTTCRQYHAPSRTSVSGVHWIRSQRRCHGDGGDHAVDAAYVASAAQAVVPLLTPLLSPRVLDDPVGAVAQPQRREAARAVADEEHAVVDPRARADERARHPAHVRLHERRVEPHREGPAADERRADLGLVAGRHGGEVGHADGDLGRVEAAGPRRARVRVRALLHQAAGLHQVRVRVRHQPAGAAVVALVLRHRAALEWNIQTKPKQTSMLQSFHGLEQFIREERRRREASDVMLRHAPCGRSRPAAAR